MHLILWILWEFMVQALLGFGVLGRKLLGLHPRHIERLRGLPWQIQGNVLELFNEREGCAAVPPQALRDIEDILVDLCNNIESENPHQPQHIQSLANRAMAEITRSVLGDFFEIKGLRQAIILSISEICSYYGFDNIHPQ